MSDFIFWKNWNRTERIFIYVFFVFFCLASAFLIYGYFYGLSDIIDWQTRQQLMPVVYNHLSYQIGPLKIRLPLNQYLVFQYFEGSILKINPIFWIIYLLFLVVSINLILAVVSTISRFWFYGAMGAFIAFVVLFQPDHILLFNNSNRATSILIFSIFLSIGYIFREFKPNLTLFYRFAVFCIATIVTGVIIYFYAGVQHPFYYLVSYGIGAPLVVSVIFILTISHEIIFGILYISSGSARSGSSRSLLHFTLMTLIYLFYVFITYLHDNGIFHWKLIYLSPVIVFFISALIGFWWLRRRENLYREILPFRPNAALLFLGFGALTFSTYGFILSVGNDPIAEIFNDAIIYGQIGFGIMFFMYLVANFGAMMAKGFNVVSLVYDSRALPFFVFRLSGLLTVVLLIYRAGFSSLNQGKAGYYNLIGDLFWHNKETSLAKVYYEKGGNYDYRNHRSNYAMASIARLENNKVQEINYLEDANLRNPSPYAYINISNRLLGNNQFFEGLFKLKEGYSHFPGSAQINNNIGFFYSKTNIMDSAFYFFSHARKIEPHSQVILSNSYGMVARADVGIPYDSVKNELGIPESEAGLANMTALANDNNESITLHVKEPLPDAINSSRQFAYFYNYGLNKLNSADTAFFTKIDSLSRKTSNPKYAVDLSLIYALGLYNNHQVGKAIEILRNLSDVSMPDLNFRQILGELFLASGDSRQALNEFGEYREISDPSAKLYYGIALLNLHRSDSAASVFKSLSTSKNNEVKLLANKYLELTGMTSLSGEPDDDMIYNYYFYVPEASQKYSLNDFLHRIHNTGIRDRLRLEQSLRWINQDKYEQAQNLLDSLEEKKPTDENLSMLKNKIEILLSIHETSKETMPDSIAYTYGPTNSPGYLYYLLRDYKLAILKNDSANVSRFTRILTWDPYFDQGIEQVSDYYNNYKKDPNSAYRVLLNALEINRYSIELNEKFILQCLELNVPEYAGGNISFLKSTLSKTDYSQFKAQMDKKIAETKKISEEWSQ